MYDTGTFLFTPVFSFQEKTSIYFETKILVQYESWNYTNTYGVSWITVYENASQLDPITITEATTITNSTTIIDTTTEIETSIQTEINTSTVRNRVCGWIKLLF